MRHPFTLLLLFSLSVSIAQTPKFAHVKQFHGRPTLFVNDEPQVPAFYAPSHATGGRWSWEEVPARNINLFCKAGIKIYQVDLYLEDIWYKDRDTLDIAKAQRQVRGVLEQCPDAGVVIRIHTNAPFWWNEAHPEERTEYANGPVDTSLHAGPPYHNEDFDPKRALRASLASERWRREAGAKIKEFCVRLSKTKEGQSVMGMHVSGGIYGEWHYWGFIEHDPDTGPAMTKYFRNWLKKKYDSDANLQKAWGRKDFTLNNATVPDTTERMRTQDGIFKDPAKEQRVIDYFRAQQEVVVEDIEFFTHTVKKYWGRPLIVGVFYGYLHMTFNRQTVGGHLLVERIMECPDIDYIAAPQTYWEDTRKAGGAGFSRGIVESAILHQKLWMDEMDNGYLHPDNQIENIRHKERYDSTYHAVFQRCTWLPLTKGIGYWLYDFGLAKGFGWWDNPRYRETIKNQKAFFEKRLEVPYKSAADVLFVWSQESFYYVQPAWSPVSELVLDVSVEEAMRAGASIDHVYDFDLRRVDLDRYKVVVFMNVYHVGENEKKVIQEKVCQHNRTVVWNYVTGYADDKTIDLKNTEDLTGILLQRSEEFEKQKVGPLKAPLKPFIVVRDLSVTPIPYVEANGLITAAKKVTPAFTSQIYTVPLSKQSDFREIFKTAGCHIYTDSGDVVYENSGLLMLHTGKAGAHNVLLRNGKTVTFQTTGAATFLLDAETGEQVLAR